MAIVGAVTACREASASDDVAPLPRATILADSTVGTLSLAAIDSLRLGNEDSTRINRISHLFPTGDRVYVVDGVAKRVLAFDRRGTLVGQYGRYGMDVDQYEDPYRVAVRGDTVLVLDLGRFSHVLTFDLSGHYLGGINWKNERMPTDLQVTPTAMFVSTTVQAAKDTVRHVLHALDGSGTARGTGCRVDPAIMRSDRDGGVVGALVFSSVSILGDRVYCAQATTPVVQVIDTAGRALAPITIAPPFYVAPVDRPLSMNTKHMMAFNASFTMHAGFTPTHAGFVSTYSRYDTTAQRTRYLLFACDSTAGVRHCGTLETTRRLLHVASPDTVYLEEPRAGNTVIVGRYLLRMEFR